MLSMSDEMRQPIDRIEGVERTQLVIAFEATTIEELMKFCKEKRVQLGTLLRELGNFEMSAVVEFRHGVKHEIPLDDPDIPAGPCPRISDDTVFPEDVSPSDEPTPLPTIGPTVESI